MIAPKLLTVVFAGVLLITAAVSGRGNELAWPIAEPAVRCAVESNSV